MTTRKKTRTKKSRPGRKMTGGLWPEWFWKRITPSSSSANCPLTQEQQYQPQEQQYQGQGGKKRRSKRSLRKTYRAGRKSTRGRSIKRKRSMA